MTGATLLDDLRACVADPGQVRDGELARHTQAHDASHFLLLPTAVVVPASAAEVGRLLELARRRGVPLTFRSGGTSLSGQGVTDQLLVDVRRHFRGLEILDDGLRVRVDPGVTVGALNARLARYGRRFGPDPASETACTVGGVLANNSSGMACGIVENSYRTLESVVAVLPSGTVIDTGGRDADERLRALEPDLYKGLLDLRMRILGNPASVARVTQQYAMKNTMGYGLNALLDHDTPSAILTHLLVGSEGTLGFVASATFRTVPLRTQIASTLLVFDDLFAASDALPALVATGAATLELMDATSLRVGQSFADCPPEVRRLAVRSQAALLLEYQACEAAELEALTTAAAPVLGDLPTTEPVRLSTDAAVRGPLWKLRKGLYASVAGARPQATTALLEDIVVPVPKLAETCRDLAVLFDRYAYADGVVFGHAKDGNIHFMLTDRFTSDEELARYSAFTEAMVELVLGNDGSLKAEHGTGRVMAPFVRRQFGDELYDVMRGIKQLFDPHGVLAPGVVISDDPLLHLKHIKRPLVVEPEVDRCTACGFCEPVCPSRDLTLTPRQRIAGRRAIVAAREAGDAALAQRMTAAYDYAAVQTCAVDGMCQTACPVLINTGDLVKRVRREEQSRGDALAWTGAAKAWAAVTRGGATALTALSHLPDALAPVATAITDGVRAVAGPDRVPEWSPDLPAGGGRRRRPQPEGTPVAVYLPSCVNAMFGPADGGPGVQAAVERLCAHVGISLRVPHGHRRAVLRHAVVVEGPARRARGDAQAGAGGGAHRDRGRGAAGGHRRHLVHRGVPHADGRGPPAAGARRPAVRRGRGAAPPRPAPQAGVGHRPPDVLVDEAAAQRHAERSPSAVAEEVYVPESWGCCAFAGDRGMLHPELTASATAAEAAQVRARGAAGHVSCNRTCELGMTRATGVPYRHVIEVLAELTGTTPP